MKYQEALFWDKYKIALETISDKDINIFERYKDCKDEAIKVLKEAIDKAQKYDELMTPNDFCPKRENEVDDTYCPSCGQALKWKD